MRKDAFQKGMMSFRKMREENRELKASNEILRRKFEAQKLKS